MYGLGSKTDDHKAGLGMSSSTPQRFVFAVAFKIFVLNWLIDDTGIFSRRFSFLKHHDGLEENSRSS